MLSTPSPPSTISLHLHTQNLKLRSSKATSITSKLWWILNLNSSGAATRPLLNGPPHLLGHGILKLLPLLLVLYEFLYKHRVLHCFSQEGHHLLLLDLSTFQPLLHCLKIRSCGLLLLS
ncbi:hypothetical protein AAHE18_06G098800 [Arachis hypogaea]